MVIPLADKLEVPREPPLNVPDLPQVKNIRIVSELAEELKVKGFSDTKLAELKWTGREEREKHKDSSDGDR